MLPYNKCLFKLLKKPGAIMFGWLNFKSRLNQLLANKNNGSYLIFPHQFALWKLLLCWILCEHETNGFWNIENAACKMCDKKWIDEATKSRVIITICNCLLLQLTLIVQYFVGKILWKIFEGIYFKLIFNIFSVFMILLRKLKDSFK